MCPTAQSDLNFEPLITTKDATSNTPDHEKHIHSLEKHVRGVGNMRPLEALSHGDLRLPGTPTKGPGTRQAN